MCACPIECDVKDPCIQCHRVSVLIGSNYCPLCNSPQDGERLPANTLDHIYARGLKEENVLNACAEYVGRMLCGTKLAFGHVAHILILIKRAKDVSIKRYIPRSAEAVCSYFNHALHPEERGSLQEFLRNLWNLYEGKRANEKKVLRDTKTALVASFLSVLGDSTFEIDRKFVHQVQGEIMDKLGNSMEENVPTELLSIRDDLVQLRILKKGKTSNAHLIHVARPPRQTLTAADQEVEIVEVRNDENLVSNPKRQRVSRIASTSSSNTLHFKSRK